MNNRPLIEIEGFREFQEKLKELGSDKDKRREVVNVLRRQAKDTVNAAKAEAPVSKKAHVQAGSRTRKVIRPGNLKRSIKTIVARRSAEPTVVVGPSAKGENDGWYGAMVSDGHNIYRSGFRRKRSSSDRARAFNSTGATGRTRENPFMKRAYQKTGGQASEKTAVSISKYLQKRIDKLSTQR